MARVFCDSSTRKACLVIEGQKPIFIVYPSPVTNNVGEYKAVLLALQRVLNNLTPITIYTDSLLVVNQVSGVWACRKHHLLPFRERIRELLVKTGVSLAWIPREENQAGIKLEGLRSR